MDFAPSAAAGAPGNPRGSDGPTGNARGSGSGTRSLRTASVLGETLGSSTSTVSVLGEILVRGTPRSKGNIRECDRSRLLGTARAFGEALGSSTSKPSVFGETLGNGTSTSKGNPRGSDGPSRDRASARESASEVPRFSSSSFFPRTETRIESAQPKKMSPYCPHQAIVSFRKTCQPPWSHIPQLSLVPACSLW